VDLPSAEKVARDLRLTADPGGALAHLVDASMLEVSFAGPARYRMLEPLRAFGLDRLAAEGETDAAEDRLLQLDRRRPRAVPVATLLPGRQISCVRVM
jgi:hypothetical protein